MERKYILLSRFTQKIKTTYLKGIKPETLIRTLQKENVNVVVDVRNWSVYPFYFNPLNLRLLLTQNKIEYVQLKALGNPKVIRDKYKHDPFLGKQEYLKYIVQDDDAREQLYELYRLLRLNKTYCLICYCPVFDPKLCHRYWLKEFLINMKRKRLGFIQNFTLNYKPKQLVPKGVQDV